MKIKIKPNKEKMYFSTLQSVEAFMTRMIARKGFNVDNYYESGVKKYIVDNLEESERKVIIDLVLKECEQIGLEYEIID